MFRHSASADRWNVAFDSFFDQCCSWPRKKLNESKKETRTVRRGGLTDLLPRPPAQLFLFLRFFRLSPAFNPRQRSRPRRDRPRGFDKLTTWMHGNSKISFFFLLNSYSNIPFTLLSFIFVCILIVYCDNQIYNVFR